MVCEPTKRQHTVRTTEKNALKRRRHVLRMAGDLENGGHGPVVHGAETADKGACAVLALVAVDQHWVVVHVQQYLPPPKKTKKREKIQTPPPENRER